MMNCFFVDEEDDDELDELGSTVAEVGKNLRN